MRHGRLRIITLFLAAPLTLYGVFVISPFAQAFYISLTSWTGYTGAKPFVGLANYRALIHDPAFWQALGHNAELLLAVPLATIVFGMFFASMLNLGARAGKIEGVRFSGLYQKLYFLPHILPVVISAVLWQFLYNPQLGLINSLLDSAGLGSLKQTWLGNPRVARLLDGSGSRLVLVGRPSPVENLPVTVVEYDNEGGAYAATSHLLSMGHRRIAYIGPDTAHNSTSATRIAGYHRALAAHGLDPDPQLELMARTGTESRILGYNAMKHVLEGEGVGVGVGVGEGTLPFTALFCFDDLVAAGAMAALREAGVSVPDDVSIIGYNDEPTALDVVPALTTVHVPHVELGRSAMRLVLDRDDPMNTALGHHMTLGTYLVLRDSVRPATR